MYGLLKHTHNPEFDPFAKKEDKLYAKDLITLHSDPVTAEWEVYINGEVTAGITYPLLFSFLDDLSEASRARKKSDFAKDSTRLIIFADRLMILECMIEDMCKVQTSARFDAHINHDVTFEITTDKIQFRNWETLANDRVQNLRVLYPGLRDCEVMAEAIRSFASPAYKVRYSLAHMTQKEFYKPILGEVRSERGCTNWESLDCFENANRGSRAGLYKHFSAGSELCWKMHRNVQSFDKKSAYPSVFVNNDHFPLGRAAQHRTKKMQWLYRCLERDTWFKIVIRTDFPFRTIFSTWKTTGENSYAFEYYDYKSLCYLGLENRFRQWLITHDDEWVIITSEGTGYLSDAFRRRIIELYNMKNAIDDKTDPNRRKYKTMIDMIFGKGIQRRNYTNLSELNDYFFRHSDVVLMPHQSMHAISAVKYELLWLNSFADDGEVIAYDTDGIKYAEGADTSHIDELNRQIMDQNRRAGFPETDIGLWAHEYTASRFVQFKTKCYAYEAGGKYHWKIAGVHKQELERFLSEIDGDPLDFILQNGAVFTVPSNYIYDPKNKIFLPTSNEYVLHK